MKLIDLSPPIFHHMPVYPGDPAVEIDIVHRYETHSWLLRKLSMGTHTGSHVDAFSHMHPDLPSLDEISLDRFLGRARLVRTDEDLPPACGLLFKGSVGIDLLPKLLDADPPFVGGELDESLERELLKHRILTYTNLIRLDELPENQDFFFIGLPLAIEKADGSPVRAVAWLDWK